MLCFSRPTGDPGGERTTGCGSNRQGISMVKGRLASQRPWRRIDQSTIYNDWVEHCYLEQSHPRRSIR
jgi:hypothetical protein